jgi:hypothetical protein
MRQNSNEEARILNAEVSGVMQAGTPALLEIQVNQAKSDLIRPNQSRKAALNRGRGTRMSLEVPGGAKT